MRKKVVQRGRSEVRDAKNNERTFADAAERERRQCLARTPLAAFSRILLGQSRISTRSTK
jgi:hypothetical protein